MNGKQQLMTDSIRKRAVFDTNVFIAAYVARNAKNPTAELIRRWRNGEFDLLYCDGIIDEIREKFAEKEVSMEDTNNLIQSLHTIGIKVDVTPSDIAPVIPFDSDDDIIIACAVKGGATHIVTYDSHFNLLGGQCRGIKIMGGLNFLYEIRGNQM
jgi:putative PIN family toxin of toxin-antitoxin system